jgi:transposase
MVANNNSLQYCQNLVKNIDSFIHSSKLTSQRISDLLYNISLEERYDFYKNWAKYRQEIEYLALDITSISSYSGQIQDLAWGYNRDNEKLKQINLCLLFGEDSRLPIYSTSYSGNVTDVKAFCDIINNFNFFKDQDTYKVVLDKGFYSKKNINKMLYNDKIKFTIFVPLKNTFIKNFIKEYEDKFNDDDIFYTGKDMFYSTTILYK